MLQATIGGSAAGQGNVISGGTTGIWVHDDDAAYGYNAVAIITGNIDSGSSVGIDVDGGTGRHQRQRHPRQHHRHPLPRRRDRERVEQLH